MLQIGSGVTIGGGISMTDVPIVTTGLVLYLDAGTTLSYPGTGTSWKDISGNGNTGTLNNGVGYNNGNQGYLTFDGIDDYVLSNNNSLSTYFSSTSISHFIWVYPTAAGQIVAEIGQTTPNINWHDSNIEISTAGAFSFSTWHGSLTNKVVSTNQSFNAWYNAGFTYNGTTLTAYLNGASVGTTTFTRQAPAQLYYALFASDSTNMGTYAYGAGRAGSFFVYNRALSGAEVTQNYNAFKGRYGL